MIKFVIPLMLIIVPVITASAGSVVVGIVFDIFLILASFRIVRPNTVKTVEFLGKYNRILRSGFNFIIPVLETTRAQDLYRKNFAVEVEGVTSDNVTAYIGLNVIYYVEDNKDDTVNGSIYNSIYSIDDARTMMRSTIDEQLRWMVVTFSHKEIFGKREEIGQAIEERLRIKLGQFGYRIDSIQVRDVQLEGSVMTSMNRVVESAKLKEAAFNEAEAQKIMEVKKAEAEKEAKILLWEGMAGQRMKIAEGFRESVEMIKWADDTLNAEKILKFLLDSSRIETLGSIGGQGNSKLIYLNENLEGNTEKLLAEQVNK